MSAPRLVIGLTGGIGCGKSAVAQRLAHWGVAVIDTDLIAHQLTAPGGAAIAPLREAFGAGCITPDGALDRAAMREWVFDHPGERARLEAILHPLIRQYARQQLDQAHSPYSVIVVPLLLETGAYRDVISRIAVVDCTEAQQIARVCQRSGLTEHRVRTIIASQVARATRLAAADDIIDNSADLVRLHQIVDALHQKYLSLVQTA